jgi:hypothetical protein
MFSVPSPVFLVVPARATLRLKQPAAVDVPNHLVSDEKLPDLSFYGRVAQTRFP